MAGNKMSTKKKEDKNKGSRIITQGNDENDEIDFSLLRKPIRTNITGFAQARKIFDQATEELKGLLINECDLIYECKVCRNLFRSLANFISHKRVYCKENFSTSIHGHFLKETSILQEVLKIRKLEESYQESLKEINESNCVENDDNEERIPISKDLTEIVERVAKQKGIEVRKLEEQKLVFQKIPKTSVAVFQNVANSDGNNDNMQTQVKELDEILSQDNAVLQDDGSFKVQSVNGPSNTDNVIQISDDDENEEPILKCRICDLQFSTQKTLKFHMKYKHLESRLVYPCPDCLDIFSTSWSVYRHLFKVHRKTAAQIRRLRESIQSKAFRMNNPPAFYEKRKAAPKINPPQKITEEERLDQENQAWLEQLEGESEGRRCGGCGRAFERRAALAAHAHTCASRHRRRIQIQIRKDYHKDSPNPYLNQSRAAAVANTEQVSENIETEEKIVEKNHKPENEKPLNEAVMTLMDVKKDELEEDKDTEMEIQTDDAVIQNKPLFYDSTFINKLPYAQQAEKSNLNALKQKMQSDIDIESLLCKKCDIKLDKLPVFLEHMGEHYKWMRYACKLCNFKHFNFEKLPEHVKVVHKLKGDTDFYYSTVKAIDGNEAKELAETTDELNDANEVSPDSRRPSRCSSDSSRLSDDSSSSSTREVGSRKRKANRYRNDVKKKKENIVTDDGDESKNDEKAASNIENDSSSNLKIFEENSSDFDDVEEKTAKRPHLEAPLTVASRRPVRKKTKPKNEDFEYDLSNLLKMDSQGYRDSQTVSTKPTQIKKKPPDLQYNYDIINKDCCGALTTLSRKSVENAKSHMKTLHLFNGPKEARISTVFVRPMIPKNARIDKISPRKDEKESKDISSSIELKESPNLSSMTKIITNNSIDAEVSKIIPIKKCEMSEVNKYTEDKPKNTEPKTIKITNIKSIKDLEAKSFTITEDKSKKDTDVAIMTDKETNPPIKDTETKSAKSTEVVSIKNTEVISIKDNEAKSNKNTEETPVKDTERKDIILNDSKREEIKDKVILDTLTTPRHSLDATKPTINLPVVPLKFRRQSLEVIKNPLIKKNMTDFTKVGMKTKILVIKPLGRNTDRSQAASLKFQTIKYNDTKSNSSKDDNNDQVVVVQVPAVDLATRPTIIAKNSTMATTRAIVTNSTINNKTSPEIDEMSVNNASVIKETKSVSDNEKVILDTPSESDLIVPDKDNIGNSTKQSESECASKSIDSDDKTSETLIDSDKSENIEV